ncbi:MAG: hypothetical protein ABIP18_14475 [Steroidobacteraceae bacterium]
MDAFDRYSLNGEHGEIFSHFRDPSDYWVRSTRERTNRVYPTKPLVGYILKKTTLNGGWGQKADAAARLHNAGYIIVDRDDKSVAPPERYSHLLRDADRIRLCALNYFNEPARERGATEVSIRASDLAEALILKDAFPNICQALGGAKFQQQAQVPTPSYTEPNPSSSTIFTYKVGSQVKDNMPDLGKAATQSITSSSPVTTMTSEPLNQILYGPPGTGKTYATVEKALAILEPGFAGGRSAKKVKFDEYVAAGQIQFVTFHQSFSYEDFVEGCRISSDCAHPISWDEYHLISWN